MTTFPKLWEALFYWLEFRYNLVQVDNREEPVAEHFAKPLAHTKLRYDTNFEDDILDVSWNESELENDDLKNYKAKAEYYIREH